MKKAIILYIIGERYERMLEILKPQYEQYAAKCGAELIVCDDYIDKSKYQWLLVQKMLLASKYDMYDWLLFMDIDILINKNAPSIFETIQEDKGFSANLSPSDTPFYRAVALYEWQRLDYAVGSRNVLLNYKDILQPAGFPIGSDVMEIINDVSDYYYNFEYTYGDKKVIITDRCGQEIAMSYISQINGLFWDMDKKFNYQIGYPLHETGIFETHRSNWRDIIFGEKYKNFVRDEFKKCYFFHFAGQCYKMPILDYQDDEILEMIY